MAENRLIEGLRELPAGDRTLLKGFFSLAVLALGLGFVYGLITAFDRAGFIDIEAETGYRMMTLHGVAIFFYWLYFVQAGLVLVLAATHTGGTGRLTWRLLAWVGLLVMIAGFVLNEWAPFAGALLLYDAQPDLVGEEVLAGGLFYIGYVLLSIGLFLVATAAIATALQPKFEGRIETWSAVGFATVAWAGLLMVSAIAAINAFLPTALGVFGLQEIPMNYTMRWHVLFHNVHYLPLMAAVVIWYVLVDVIAGVRSVFGARFSKIVFASYLVFVPPTSLYHMFLEPGLSETVKATGSILSLFISVPTILVFLIILASLESHARALGIRGLFGWLRMLPWKNPAMAAIGMAVINTALGGIFSFVLIQERMAPLLSDTFFVPGYFHFLTLGTVTLSFLAALMYVIPGLTGRRLWNPALLAKMPYLMTLGLAIFGASGIAAGYMGVPRRTFDVVSGGLPAVWEMLMTWVGVGALLMAASLAVYVWAFARTLVAGAREKGAETAGLPTVAWGGVGIGHHAAWVGPLAVLILIAGMYVFTALGFEIMQSLPIISSGGHGGH
jgi:cytochrome c oxidase subunit 1